MRYAFLAALLATLALALVACGDSEDAPSATSTPPATATQPAPESACADATLTEDALAALPALAGAPGRIAFACEGQIWMMRPDGGDQRPVTEATEIDYERVRLYRVPEDEPPSAAEIADLEAKMNSAPQWLPDGRIVFASIRDTLALSAAAPADAPRPFVNASELYVVAADGTGLERLTEYNFTAGAYAGSDFNPTGCLNPDTCFAGLLVVSPLAVSPDGAQVAVNITEIRFSECCGFAAIASLDDGTLERVSITPGEPEGGDSLGLSWAPDGERAAFNYYRGSAFAGPYTVEVAVRDLATDEDTLLLQGGEGGPLVYFGQPAWSPVDERIAFCARTSFEEPLAVYTIDAAGGEPEQLNTLAPAEESLGPPPCAPTWSPDGRFLAVDSGDGAIVIIDAETGDSAKVALGGQPAWGPAE